MKIICIAKNYAKHAKEMSSAIPKEPIFFMKPDTALLQKNRDFYYPDFTQELHYETEIVVRINKVGKHIQEKFAHKYYSEIGIGIDFTARDLQRKCKETGSPWEIAKAFDNSAPVSKFIDKTELPENIDFSLKINNKQVQKGNTENMIFSVDKLISYLSEFITLKIGDLIFTGTPEGVGQIKIGDKLEAFIGNENMLKINIK